jgi:DMSO/TMAO reductase YedYZ molybdopterin-dependent catalytic subunit
MKIRVFGAALLLLAMVGVPRLAEAAGPAESAGPTVYFQVLGNVQNPTTFDIRKLQALPAVNQNVTYFSAGSVVSQSFTGALLWDLLQSVGIRLDSTIKNDILHQIVIVTGSDGYESVFGAGELAPNFGGNQITIAYKVNGQALGIDGFARIVAPGDKQGGRFVSNITKIVVKNIP